MIVAQAFQESGIRPSVFQDPGKDSSPRGLLQVRPIALSQVQSSPANAKFKGFNMKDMLDAAKNIEVATAYLQQQINSRGSLRAALGGRAYGTGHYDAITTGAASLRADPSSLAKLVAAMKKAKSK